MLTLAGSPDASVVFHRPWSSVGAAFGGVDWLGAADGGAAKLGPAEGPTARPVDVAAAGLPLLAPPHAATAMTSASDPAALAARRRAATVRPPMASVITSQVWAARRSVYRAFGMIRDRCQPAPRRSRDRPRRASSSSRSSADRR